MDETRFWELIERGRQQSGGDVWHQAALLTDSLAQLEPEEILSFDQQAGTQMGKAYRADIWAAVYLVYDGCSEDGFEAFLGWLLAQGKEVFTAVLANPGCLGDLLPPEDVPGCEDMLFVTARAYRRRTGGQEIPEYHEDHDFLEKTKELREQVQDLVRRHSSESEG
jgi:hypothetical protein